MWLCNKKTKRTARGGRLYIIYTHILILQFVDQLVAKEEGKEQKSTMERGGDFDVSP